MPDLGIRRLELETRDKVLFLHAGVDHPLDLQAVRGRHQDRDVDFFVPTPGKEQRRVDHDEALAVPVDLLADPFEQSRVDDRVQFGQARLIGERELPESAAVYVTGLSQNPAAEGLDQLVVLVGAFGEDPNSDARAVAKKFSEATKRERGCRNV